MHIKCGLAFVIFFNTVTFELNFVTRCQYLCILEYQPDLPFARYLLSYMKDHNFYESDQPASLLHISVNHSNLKRFVPFHF